MGILGFAVGLKAYSLALTWFVPVNLLIFLTWRKEQTVTSGTTEGRNS